jgi:hypothetical protein
MATLGALVTSALLASAIAISGHGDGNSQDINGPLRPQWLIKGQDYYSWDSPGDVSEGVAAAAKAAQVTLPHFTWMTCGVWNGVTYGYSDHTTCTKAPNSVLVVEKYYRLVAALKAGFRPTTVLFDLETWQESGGESHRPKKWIQKMVRLTDANGIRLIVSTGGGLKDCSACWAAASGAYRVSVESQYLGVPSRWESLVRQAAKIIGDNRIIVGIGTNTPPVHSASSLTDDVNWALSHGINQFWINANNWQALNKCTPAEGSYGCPMIAVRMFADLAKPPF